MEEQSKQHGRTFWDFIAEHPKSSFYTFLIVLLFVIAGVFFLVKNKYDIDTPYGSIKSKSNDSVTIKPVVTSVDNQNLLYPKKTIVPKAKNQETFKKISMPTKYRKDTLVLQPTISVSSNHQSGGQTAYQINNNNIPEPRSISDAEKAFILKTIPKDKLISVCYFIGVPDGPSYANQILTFLKNNGYKIKPDIYPLGGGEDVPYDVTFGPPNPEDDLGDLSIRVGWQSNKKTMANH